MDKHKAKPKQYILHVAGYGIGVSFTPAEEARVIGRAKRRGLTVESWATQKIEQYVRSQAKTGRRTDDLIVRAAQVIAKPKKRAKGKA